MSMVIGHQQTLTLYDVRYSYPARPDFLGPISAVVEPGQCWAIVGPNGAGKSTLLRIMAGLRAPKAGRVSLGAEDLHGMPARRRARRIAFLPQQPPVDLNLSARDVVVMGRFPHRSMGLFESADDYRVADQAMAVTHTSDFADRPVASLSGGEAQRVHLAAALAQQPAFLLLDEPTSSLDLQHQLTIFEILRDRAAGEGLGVIVVTHDVNLAARFCSHVLLLDDGALVASGPPETVLTPAVMEPVYRVELAMLTAPDNPARHWVVPIGPARGGRA